MQDLTADLPPPRDDEPATLRQDIVDELADHLACALRREQLTSASASGGCQPPDPSNSSAPWQRVLTRFGNPQTIARRLWLDAMKERLMAQKITILLASVATAAVVFLSVIMWRTLERSQDAQRQAHESQLALIQQHEQFTAGILKKLESLGASPAPAAATGVDGWTPLTVKLVSEEGEPVEGEVLVSGTPIGGDKSDVSVSRSTGPGGVIECGMVPYGNYQLKVTATAAEETHTEHFMVAPGQPSERTVVCPKSPPPDVEMRFAFNPPEELRTDQLRYVVILLLQPRRIGESEWSTVHTDPLPGYIRLWVDASGRILKKFDTSHGGSAPDGLTGLQFTPPPALREYVYQLQFVQMYVGDIRPNGPGYSQKPDIDEWAVAANKGFQLRQTETFEPKAGAENVWKVNMPEDEWAAAFDAFRGSPWARHVTIPDGWATVSIPQVGSSKPGPASLRFGTQQFGLGNAVNVGAVLGHLTGIEALNWHRLIDSARLIAFDPAGPVAGFQQDPAQFVLMVTPHQQQVIEELKRRQDIRIHLATARDELPTPVLHEETLEELRQAAKSDEAVEGAGDNES